MTPSTELVVVDSHVLARSLSRAPKYRAVRELVDELQRQGRCAVSAVGLAEVWEGSDHPRRRAALAARLPAVKVLSFGPREARIAGAVRRLLRRGGAFPDADGLIAATCLSYRAELLTEDAHFARVAGLRTRRP